jgi:hypothetical protein
VDAIAKIQNDYLKHAKLLGLNGGFAILYPQELAQPMPVEALRKLVDEGQFKLVAMFPPEDARPFLVHEGRLVKIADTIADYVLQPPKLIEPSVAYIIRALRETANYIVAGLRHLSGKSLKDFFGGESVFTYILQYEEGEIPEEDMRLGASYLLVNQLLFYHVLQRRRTGFDEIDPDTIDEPKRLERYFERVMDVNYRAIFAFNVASLISPKFTNEVRKIISVVHGVAPEKVGGDLLGTIFHDLIPFDVRKRVAAFYTNVFAAELLSTLSLDKSEAKVADFAVGSGGLLVSAYRRKKELLGGSFGQEQHRRFVEEELYGIDVMPFAANVAACHLALQSPQFLTNKANIAIWDSTDIKPGIKIPSAAHVGLVLTGQSTLDTHVGEPKRRKGVVSLREETADQEIQLNPVDLVIMNPPFTRQERIPEEYKRVLVDRFSDGYKEYLHGQMGYYAYFILLADRFLEEDGRIAFVLPATVLRVQSCEGVRKLLAKKYHVEFLITNVSRSAFSESTRFREILLVARKLAPRKKTPDQTCVAVLKELPNSIEGARSLAFSLRESKSKDVRFVAKYLDYSILKSDTENWFKFVALKNHELYDEFKKLMRGVETTTLGDFTEIMRGYELRGGTVQPLVLYPDISRVKKKSDVWEVKDETGSSVKVRHRILNSTFSIPLSSLRKTIRRPAGLERLDVSGDLDYAIVKANTNLMEQIRNVSGKKITTKLLDALDSDIESRLGNFFVTADMDLSAPGTHAIAFYSREKVAPTKSLWSMSLSDSHAKIMTLYFNSTLNLVQVLAERAETRGAFIRIREYFLKDFLVPDLKRLSSDAQKILLETFRTVSKTELPSLLEQLRSKNKTRRAIDLAWLKVLGFKKDPEIFLDQLCSSLTEEIDLLKHIMAEGEEAEDEQEED